MVLKKEMMKMLVLVLFLMMAFTVEARFDANTLVGQMFKENGGEAKYLMKSTTTACCDKCFCTKSRPPQCHCRDIGETCHSACKLCVCALIYPPQCRCIDTTNFCYPPCSSPDKPHMIATI